MQFICPDNALTLLQSQLHVQLLSPDCIIKILTHTHTNTNVQMP